jgi:hypothetical protein
MHNDQLPQITIGSLLKLDRQIQQKRRTAKRDGIAFAMTHEEALELALSSPHWKNIGCTRGSYQFCRHDHSIGYTLDNTFIGSSEDNIRERNQRCGHPLNGEDLSGLTPDEKRTRHNAQKKKWRAANPDYDREYYKQLSDDKKTRRNTLAKAWLAANPDYHREYHKQWRTRYRDKNRQDYFKTYYQKRKAAASLDGAAANSNEQPSDKRTLQLPFES